MSQAAPMTKIVRPLRGGQIHDSRGVPQGAGNR
jgi:hypothetical protein